MIRLSVFLVVLAATVSLLRDAGWWLLWLLPYSFIIFGYGFETGADHILNKVRRIGDETEKALKAMRTAKEAS